MSDGPISRRKSCGECAKAKRKCGMEIPKCRRCTKKNIECSYPNTRPPLSEMTFPELEFPWLDDLMREPGMLPWSGTLQPHLGVESVTPFSMTSEAQNIPQHIPDYLISAEGPTRTALARSEMEAAVRHFRTYPDKWLREGKAPFIHQRLYASKMPTPLQDAYAACAIYSTKTEQNEFVAFTIIEAKANDLLRSPNQPSWTPLDLLAAVQALLIFQLIRLFDGDIRQRALAEQAEPVLEAWTEQLKTRTEAEQKLTTITAPTWRAWIFGESVRRTITMSIFLCGIYSLVKRGFCTRADDVTARSFTAQRRLWDATSASQWDRARQLYPPYWVTKMNFDPILQEAKGNELDDFGMVMIITYKGQDTVDNWLASTISERNLVMDPDFQQSLQTITQFGTHAPPWS
ncbi:uncharacterized protein BDR25DRAFT_306604 [Lindgomyces ingoldianus]|uniref:Uncharacterized protein n=1 Tax=Lindgomyces ingoldianus TaxID=673940 RepID=A0ACB6QH32_9PLEO|nr:uncharacterized protein BDR25DRAFT_306604 [Lindgomyces ingoldianus]KAF2465456.1 hypothetical protein BDR25DRAFT_306604 [Lindgomyces ingoldianus]